MKRTPTQLADRLISVPSYTRDELNEVDYFTGTDRPFILVSLETRDAILEVLRRAP